MRAASLVTLILASLTLFAQEPDPEWKKVLGGYTQKPRYLTQLSTRDFESETDRIEDSFREKNSFEIKHAVAFDFDAKERLVVLENSMTLQADLEVVRYTRETGRTDRFPLPFARDLGLIPNFSFVRADREWLVLVGRVNNGQPHNEILVFNYRTQEKFFVKPQAGVLAKERFTLSPDGRYFANLHEKKVEIWDLTTQKKLQNQFFFDAIPADFVFSRKSDQFTLIDVAGRVIIYDVATGRATKVWKSPSTFTGPNGISRVALSAETSQIILGTLDGKLLAPLKGNKELTDLEWMLPETARFVHAIEFYPGGDVFAVEFNIPPSHQNWEEHQGTLAVGELRRGRRLTTVEYSNTPVKQMQFSPGATRFARLLSGGEGNLKVWNLK